MAQRIFIALAIWWFIPDNSNGRLLTQAESYWQKLEKGLSDQLLSEETDLGSFQNATLMMSMNHPEGFQSSTKMSMSTYIDILAQGNATVSSQAVSVCDNDTPVLRPTKPQDNICRVLVNRGYDDFGLCSGSMVSNKGKLGEQAFMLAAHCVIGPDFEFSIADLEEHPSYVCCSDQDPTKEEWSVARLCPMEGRWRVRGVAIPKSYADGRQIVSYDDGAIFMLSAAAKGKTKPVSLSYNWTALQRNELCKEQLYLYAGYPQADGINAGCNKKNIDGRRLYVTEQRASVRNCMSFDDKTLPYSGLEIPGAGCQGLSGAPVFAETIEGPRVIGTVGAVEQKCSSARPNYMFFSHIVSDNQSGFNPDLLLESIQYNKRIMV